jgi:hypothetical protein
MTRRMSVPAAVLACAALSVVGAAAQDPLVVDPDAYRLAFENAWVKVVRVRYAPHAVLAPHFHTPRAAAYVYLNDGGPIVFRHEGLPYAAVTRPATKAGSFRVYKGLAEVHAVENPTATPSEFLRVEFKTEPLEEATLRGKFRAASGQRVEFENAQVRITRLTVAAGDAMAVTAGAGVPALLVALAPLDVVLASGPGQAPSLQPGAVEWVEPGRSVTVRAVTAAADALRFDFTSRPLETR